MNRAVEDPANPGQIVLRPMMYLALSYDHRIVDGEQAVRFGSQPGRDGEWVSRASTHDQLRRIEYIGTIYIEMI
jgi:hypothetical protein